MFLHMTNLFLMLAIPIVVINVKSDYIGVYGATWVTIVYAVLFLKMWSYIQVKGLLIVSSEQSDNLNKLEYSNNTSR